MKTLRFFILIALSGIIVAACGSDDNNAAAPAANPTPNNSRDFYISDNDCYRASNNQRVSNSNCSGYDYAIRGGQCYKGSERSNLNNCTRNTYYMSDNGCYDRSGNTVAESRCGSYDDNHYDDEYDYDNGSGSNACRGPHLFFDDDGEIYEVNCDGRSRTGNCSEYYLFDIDDQNWVHCG